MKAMILAAGRGDRMRPLTDNCPKPLLKADGVPLIEHHIKKLVSHLITDIVINHAYLGKMIESTLKDGRHLGANIQYSAEGEALETGGGIFKALPLLGDEPFLVVNGDVWCDIDYADLPSQIDTLAHLVMIDNPQHNPNGDFHFHDNRLHVEGGIRLTYSGIGIYHPDLFVHCTAGKFPLAPLLRQAIADKQISAQHYRGYWLDVGTPERLAELNQHLSKNA